MPHVRIEIINTGHTIVFGEYDSSPYIKIFKPKLIDGEVFDNCILSLKERTITDSKELGIPQKEIVYSIMSEFRYTDKKGLVYNDIIKLIQSYLSDIVVISNVGIKKYIAGMRLNNNQIPNLINSMKK